MLTNLLAGAPLACARRPLRGIYEGFPLLCSRCGEPMRLIAFVTEVSSLKPIPEHLGALAYLPGIARAARDPSDGEGTSIHANAICSLGVSPYPSMNSTSRVSG